MSEPTPIRTPGKRRYPLALRLRVLRLLFGRNRKLSFSRRLTLLSRRYRIAARTVWRWVRRYRAGGADGLRDHVRRDTLTRRAPANVASISGAEAVSALAPIRPAAAGKSEQWATVKAIAADHPLHHVRRAILSSLAVIIRQVPLDSFLWVTELTVGELATEAPRKSLKSLKPRAPKVPS